MLSRSASRSDTPTIAEDMAHGTDPRLHLADTVQREQAVESPSGLSMTSGRKSPLPDIRLSPGEVEEEQYVLDSLDQIDDFRCVCVHSHTLVTRVHPPTHVHG